MKSIILIISAVLIQSAMASAMGLKQTVDEYLKSSSQIQSARYNYEAAKNDYKKAWSQVYPSLSIQASSGEQKFSFFGQNPVGSHKVVLQLQQSLYLGGRVWNTLELRGHSRDLAHMTLKETQRGLTLAFSEKLLRYVALQKKLELLKESRDIQEGFLKITKRKVKQGNARSFELDQVTADFYAFYPRIRELERGIENLEKEIRADLMKPQEPLNLNINLDQKVESLALGGLEELLNEAQQKRPDYIVSRLQVDISRVNKSIVMGEHRPTVVFQGEVGYLSSQQNENLFNDPESAMAYSLNITIPLFSGLSSVYDRRATENKIYSSEKEFAQKNFDLKKEIQNALEDYDASRESIDYSRIWAENAERALTKGSRSYRSGIINNTQIVQLQQSKERAASALVDAKVALRLSILKLKAVLGREIL